MMKIHGAGSAAGGDLILTCIACRNPIHLSDDDIRCDRCGAHVSVHEGIVDFMPEQDFYWGEVSRETMRRINDCAERDGWFGAVRSTLRYAPSLLALVLDSSRMGWLFHCLDDAREECLDLGSGWGSHAFYLSGIFGKVYSVDAVRERLHFQVIRAWQEGITNIAFLRAPLNRIPLPDDSVDLVVMNGVLEWAGLSDLYQPPRQLQMQLLSEARRVLRSAGHLYIGIENRFGLQYFLGGKDHSGLPFTSLMPRKLADFVVRLFGKKARQDPRRSHHFETLGYRTLTYSAPGYEQMLRSCGFPAVATYWAWPSYTYAKLSGPLQGKAAKYVLYDFRNRVTSPLLRAILGMLRIVPDSILTFAIRAFSPHFLIVAGGETTDGSVQRRVTASLPPELTFVRSSLGTTPSLRTTYLVTNGTHVSKAIRVEFDHEGFRPSGIPRLDERQTISGRGLRPHSLGDIQAVSEWLLQYQASTQEGQWSAEALVSEMGGLTEFALQLDEVAHASSSLEKLRDVYAHSVRQVSLPIVAEHGDFAPCNILISTSGRVVPIDWEHHRDSGNPLMDVGAMTFSYLRLCLHTGDYERLLMPNRPLSTFLRPFVLRTRMPVFLAPSYFLLRLMRRIDKDQQPRRPDVYYCLMQWAPLVRPIAEFSLRMTAAGYSLLL